MTRITRFLQQDRARPSVFELASWPLRHQQQHPRITVAVQKSAQGHKCHSSSLHAVQPVHIPLAIIGGGVGGLTAARVLQRNGLDAQVFEREVSRESRGQGGVLDLHPESGQWALIQAGLEAEFRAMAKPEGQDLRILDKSGTALWEEVSPPDLMERPEVDRPALRAVLLDSLLPGTIKWDHQLVSIDTVGERGGRVLHFANGSEIMADLVVGADGANSRVRPLVTDARPSYSGVSFIECGVPDAESSHPELAKLVGRGSLFVLGEHKGIIAQRTGSGRIRIYVALRMPREDFTRLSAVFNEPAVARSTIMEQFQGWAPEFLGLIEACDDIFLPRPISAMPVGITWASQPGVTLLGDAAHLMSPFAGAGANLAMQDGAELALELVAAKDPNAAVTAYEKQMFQRAEEAAGQSAEGLEMCLSWDGATEMARQMQRYQSPP